MDFAYDATKSVLSLAGDGMLDLRFTKTTLGKGSPFQHHHFHVRYLSSRGVGSSFFFELFLLLLEFFDQDRHVSAAQNSNKNKLQLDSNKHLLDHGAANFVAVKPRRKGMAI